LFKKNAPFHLPQLGFRTAEVAPFHVRLHVCAVQALFLVRGHLARVGGPVSYQRGKIRLRRAAGAAAVPTAVLTHMRAHLIEVGEWLEAVHALVHSAALVHTVRNRNYYLLDTGNEF
jgi:hypothetical protein